MLPCPGLPTTFLPLTADGAMDIGVASLGGGSSSEKDSQAGSSLVTVLHARSETRQVEYFY